MTENNFKYYPLTHSQMGIWDLEQVFKGTAISNIGGTLLIEEEMDFDILERAINRFIEKNDSIRIRIKEVNCEPIQYIDDFTYKKLDTVDFTRKSKEVMDKWISNKMHQTFKLLENDLFEFVLIKSWNGQNGYYAKLHHMIADAWTMALNGTQTMEYYKQLKDGLRIIEEKNPSYIEYISSEQAYKDSPRFHKDREFWLNKLKDNPGPTMLKMRDAAWYSSKAKRISYYLDKEASEYIRQYGKEYKFSPAVLFEAALCIYLEKMLDTRNITIGTLVFNRSGIKEKATTGMFISTVPIIVAMDSGKSYFELCRQISREHMEVFRHQKYPYNTLLSELRELHGISQNLYDICISYQNAKILKENIQYDFNTNWYFNGNLSESLNIGLDDRDNEGIFRLHYDFLEDMFEEQEIIDLHKRLMLILKQGIEDPQKQYCEYEFVDEEEKHRLLYDFNDTQADYPREKTIVRLFEEQAERTPEHTALVCGGRELSYKELNARSNRLARTLRNMGVKRDAIVGIMVSRSMEMITGILGILKAGGAYLPLDPEYPEARIEYMLEDSGAGILLSQKQLIENINYKGKILNMEEQSWYSEEDSNLEKINEPRDMAYVIYTSGSTGKPKGVVLEHGSVCNFIKGMTDRIEFTGDKSILNITTISFDIFVLETILPLTRGMRIVIANEDQQRDSGELSKIILKRKIDILQATPSRMQLLLKDENSRRSLDNLSEIIIGGEAFPQHMLEELKELTSARIYNVYGPTETTVWSTLKELSRGQAVNIGKPIANTQIYILNSNNKMQAAGIAGELCIAGDGLARGYLNREELTCEKFVPDPFHQGKRMYRSGDLARWLPDGDIEYIGRMDQQVKIRGYRIELGEIENLLLKYPSIKESAVTANTDDSGGQYLCAYITAEGEMEVSHIREYLKQILPDYIVPSYFVQLEKLPFTPNGKLDRKALPKPEYGCKNRRQYEAPETELEKKLAGIWQSVFNIEKIGMNDNFFELGGHSLKAAAMAAQIHKSLNVEINVKEIFQKQTVKELSKYIMSRDQSVFLNIEPVEEKEYYPLPSAQKRLFMLNLLEDTGVAYNMPAAMVIKGDLDILRLEAVFRLLIERQQIFRTSFKLVDGEPVQRVHKDIDFKICRLECKEGDEQKKIQDFIRPFDMGKAPLLRVGLIKIHDRKHILLHDMHHIISDGTTMGIIIKEFISIYNSKQLPELRIQYRDYSVWQNELLKSDRMKKQKEYWLDTLTGEMPVLNMPADYPRPSVQSFAGNSVRFHISREITEALARLAANTGTTLYMVLLAAYNILLSRYTGQEDIIVGSPVSVRNHPDIENMAGMFVNTLAIRNYPEGCKSFTDFLTEVKENAINAYENQDYPYEELIENLDIKRDLSRNPLFDTMFILQNTNTGEFAVEGLVFEPLELDGTAAKFDITLSAAEYASQIHLDFEYCTSLFKAETIERLAGHFINILEEIIKNPEIQLSQIEVLSRQERDQILLDFNNTKADYPGEKTIVRLFEEQAQRTPERTALVCGDKELSYRELNARSNRLARTLRNMGVKRDAIVGIMVSRSMEMIAGILGILKAGGAYLPLDPEYPRARIEYMLEDSSAGILLSQKHLTGNINYKGKILNMEEQNLYSEEDSNLEKINDSRDMAYVIYTSGSTGKPKGVVLEHGSVCNFIKGMTDRIEFTGDKSILNITTISFDIFVSETILPLTRGLRIVIANEDQQRDSRELSELILKNKIDILQTTPSRLQLLLKDENGKRSLGNLSEIIIGGEAFPTHMLEELKELTSARIYNAYGPTETTVWSTLKELSRGQSVNIGKPIANTQIYILNSNNKMQPVGIAGELCIAGDGLARGYLNREELTGEKFVPDPFHQGKRMYRSGDLARWLPDGDIEYIGRMDQQVKIRGYRIELGEIENLLLKYPSIKEAAVTANTDDRGGQYLCAYMTADGEMAVSHIREYLKQTLPDYMIPSYFVQLEKLPFTPNGKLDRKALPELATDNGHRGEYAAPENMTQDKIIHIWKKILNIQQVGVDDNFLELGGNSLKAIELVGQIYREFNIHIPVKEVFKTLTVRELSRCIKNSGRKEYSTIGQIEERAFYPVTSAQKRLFILNHMEKEQTGYNIPGALQITGTVDSQQVEAALRKLAARHDVLRTSFDFIDGEPVQIVHRDAVLNLDYCRLEQAHQMEENEDSDQYIEYIESAARDFVRPFNISKAPLMRARLLKVSEEKHVLLFDIHHIIADGLSINILEREFIDLIAGRTLPELDIQYKDYTIWQNEQLESDYIKAQEKYWLNIFSKEAPVLDMPADFERPKVQSYSGDTVKIPLDNKIIEKLKYIAVHNRTTVYTLLLTVYKVLLFKYTGQEDIVVGIGSGGRNHPQLSNVIGMFVNMLPLRSYPRNSKTFAGFFNEVKESLLNAYDNQDYQFDRLVKKLRIKRDAGRNPLFDMASVLQNIDMQEINAGDLSFKAIDISHDSSHFDLHFKVMEGSNRTYLVFEYNTKLFKKETIKNMADYFMELLDQVGHNPQLMLGDLAASGKLLLADSAANIQLVDFNF